MFRKAFRQAALKIPFENLTRVTYTGVIALNIPIEEIENIYFKMYESVGLTHGKRVGKSINAQMKRFEIDFFDIEFRRTLAEWLRQNAGTRITSVHSSLVKELVDYISGRVEEGQTMDEIVRGLQKYIRSRNFYRWQIDRIVRTETTAAANYGASRAGDVSGVLMVKEWVSSSDARTRRHEMGDVYDHIDMDGVRVPKDGMFSVPDKFGGVDNILFPGDPKGRPGNVINCRCTNALIPQRDEAGQLIFT